MKKQGFTLIELMIYIGIVSAVLVFTIDFLWTIVSGSIKETSYQEVQQNARFALIKITQEVKKAKNINAPIAGESESFLSLEMASSPSDPTLFDVNEGKLMITRGASQPQEITSDWVVIRDLRFTNLSYLDTPGTIQIEMLVEHLNPSGQTEYQASLNLRSTVSLLPGGAPP